MEFSEDNVFELEDASTIEELSTPVVTLDSMTLQKSLELPTLKSSITRTGAK